MPSRYDRASSVTQSSARFAVVPAIATLVSVSALSRALAADGGAGVTFPFPSGLPTLWTYVSLPTGSDVLTVAPGSTLVAALPPFVVGLLVTSALEAGLLGSLNRRIDGRPVAFGESVRTFTLRMVLVNLFRAATVLAALPFLAVPPLALVAVLVLSYLLYGLPFAVVVGDRGIVAALETTVSQALSGGAYASFGLAHLLAGAAGSLFLTPLALTASVPGILVGTAIVAVPAVFVAAYGLLVVRHLDGETRDEADRAAVA